MEGQTPCLKNLFVEGFDVEQIWSQFERFDRAASLGYKRMSKRLDTNLRLISDETDAEVDALLQMDENTESEQVMLHSYALRDHCIKRNCTTGNARER